MISRIKHVDFSYNPLFMKYFEFDPQEPVDKPAIVSLNLRTTFLGNNNCVIKLLYEVINTGLERIDFQNNGLTEVSEDLVNLIALSKDHLSLDLSFNALSSLDIFMILNGISSVQVKLDLDMSHNKVNLYELN